MYIFQCLHCVVPNPITFTVQADKIVPYFGDLFTDEPLPGNGFIDLPNRLVPQGGLPLCG